MRKTNAALVAVVAIATAVATTLALLTAYTGQVTNAFAEAPKWTLTYHENAGTSAVAGMPDPKENVVSYDGRFDISSSVPEREGFTFLGWGTSPQGVLDLVRPGTTGYEAAGKHTDLYAQWRPDKFILHYDVNEAKGGVSGAPADQEAISDANSYVFQIADSPEIKGTDNREFLGWADTPDATAPTYGCEGKGLVPGSDGTVQQSTSLAAVVNVPADVREKTVYAVWATRFTLAFDANAAYGGEGPVPETMSVVSVNESHVFTIPAEQPGTNVPTKADVAGYGFEKWGLTPERPVPELEAWDYGQDVMLWADGTKTGTSQGNGNLSPNVTLYARYRPTESMKLIYDANLPSGVNASNMPANEVYDGTDTIWRHAISTKAPTAPSRHFRGWATRPDASAPEYQPGAMFAIDRDVSYTATLYAVWQAPHKFSVTFHANAEGASLYNVEWYGSSSKSKASGTGDYGAYVSAISGEVDAQTSTYARGITAGATRVGYRLLGWSANPNAATPDEGFEINQHYTSPMVWLMVNHPMNLDDGESGGCAGGVTHNWDYYAVWAPQHAFQLNFDGNLPAGYNSYYRNYYAAYNYVGKTYDGIYQQVSMGSYQRGPALIRTEYLDLSKDSFTLPPQAGVRAEARGLKFLGWATTPDATVPEYTVGEDGRFEQTITLYDTDGCKGGVDPLNPNDVMVHHTTFYAVWQLQHCYAIEFYRLSPQTGDTSALSLGGESLGGTAMQAAYGPSYGISCVRGVFTTASMDPTIREHTIAEGTSLYSNRSGYRFLGWSKSPDATTVDYRVDDDGKLLDAITLIDPDDECEGGYDASRAVRHVTPLYAVYEPLHRFGVVFTNGGSSAARVYRTTNGWEASSSKTVDSTLTRYTPYMAASITEHEVPAGTMGAYATREGYLFLGWAYRADATEPDFTVDDDGYLQQALTLTEPADARPCVSGNVSHDITLYPVWEPLHAFGLRFHTTVGTNTQMQLSYRGAYHSALNTWIGNRYPDGWEGDINNANKNGYALRAEWVPTSQTSYTIPADLIQAYHADKDGYIFKGWSFTEGATTPDPALALNDDGFFASDIVLSEPNADCEGGGVQHYTDLYAVWEPAHRYQLRFNRGDATSVSRTSFESDWLPMSSTSHIFAADSVRAYAVKDAGSYRFLGWSSNPNAVVPEYRVTSTSGGSSTWYYTSILDDIRIDDSAASCEAGAIHTLDLYPVFDVPYILTYDGNGSGATGVPAADTLDVPRNADGSYPASYAMPISEQAPTRRRFRFVGWSDEKTGVPKYGYQNSANISLANLTQGLSPTISLTPATRRATLYAIWYYEFEMNFDLNATGSASWNAATKQYAYSSANNVAFKIPSTDVAGVPQWYDTEAGVQRAFLGWNEKSDGTGAMYQPGSEVPITAANDGFGSKTLYAIWEPLTVAGGQSDAPLAAQSDGAEDEGSPLFVGLPADPAADDVRHPGEDEAIVPADDEDAIE